MTKRPALLFVLAVALLVGCGRKQHAIRMETVTEVTLFDSEDSTHPSPRDPRWTITNAEVVAQISPIVVQGDTRIPMCPAVGSIQTVDALNRTNRYFMTHIHFPQTIRLDGVGIVRNGDVLLQRFAQLGVPTNKLFATSGKD